jgi:hypothetical protein
MFNKMRNKRKTWIVLMVLMAAIKAFCADIWVSPYGNDKNSGLLREQPKQTLHAALRQAREMRRLNDPSVGNGINILLEKGIYCQPDPLLIRPEDSGTPGSPTLIKGIEGNGVIISGGVELSGWKRAGRVKGLPPEAQNKIWMVDVPLINGNLVDFRQLWIDGRKAVRARNVADFRQMDRIFADDTENEILWVPAKAVEKIRNAPHAELILHQMWAIAVLRIQSIAFRGDSAGITFHSPESRIQFEHPWPRPMIGEGVNSPFYVTNALGLLDRPGEWYFNKDVSRLYYYPMPGEEINKVSAVIPFVETLVEVKGTVDRPVEHIRFENIHFNHTTWLRPSEKGHVPLQAGMYLIDAYRLIPKQERGDGNHPLDNQAWIGRPPAAVEVEAAHHIVFENCTFEHLGSCGLDFKKTTRDTQVVGCLFSDIAGNGIQIGIFSETSFETHLPYCPCNEREVCSRQVIENNYIANVGNEDWGCVGICAGYVRDILIRHNEICDLPYTGISVGWGWTRSRNCMRNNRIIANNVHHFAKHMHDVAGIYTLSAQPYSVIAENYVHDIVLSPYAHDPDHWFYLYTDEGSSYIEVKNNWCDAEKFLQNANGPGVMWENNGPMVDDAVRERAGLQPAYFYLKDK